jgi:two-component system phosphate regulon sensor histidine kinase PhoR
MDLSHLLVALSSAIAASAGTFAYCAARARRPHEALIRAASAMAEGDRAVRAELQASHPLAPLAHLLNRIADEHQRSHDALRAERDRLSSILDGMGEGVLLTDADERIVLANRAFRSMALVGDDAIGKPVIEAVRSAALKEALDAASEQNEAVVREIELGRVLPRKLLVRVSPMPFAPAGERQTESGGLIAVFHDVTDLRRLETIRTDFVANVSHELRTPVTAISTAAETLLGGALGDPEAATDFVQVIDRNATRLRHLVDDLLDLSRLESKGFKLAVSDLEVHPILVHVASLLKEPAARRKISIAVEGSDAPGLRARIDRRALEQVLSNLLDNAIKYAGEGARVTLRARSEGPSVVITVADDGVGISPAHLGRLFERFYRVDTGRSRELGGTGLGLSIVKHLVERMSGAIEVESEPGKGSCFTICLPASSRS